MIKLFLIFASLGRVGFFPKAPGTLGTSVALIPLFFLLKINTNPYILWNLLALLFASGWLSSHYLLKHSSFKDSDPSYIVIDEAVGIWLTVLLLLIFYEPSWRLYVLSFIAFRIFDILKPFPINWLDKSLAKYQKLAALGIMIDDIAAGIAAALSIELANKFFDLIY